MTAEIAPAASRRRYIDWARGIAVLIMIEAHAIDSWTRVADRSSRAFGYFMVLGGCAAPMFLWLAGLGLVLSADRTWSKTGRRWQATEAVVRRGLEIFILAFLFRMQAFIVSPGSSPVVLFRVDILNVMGPAIAAAGLLWGVSGGRRKAVATLGVVAVAIAMGTPLIRTAEWVDRLPLWFQWYLRPAGDNTTFMLFPWAGFVFAGAACGTVLALSRDDQSEPRALAGLALAGAAVLILGIYTASRPSIYEASSYWTSSPTYFAVRAGGLMLTLALLYLASPIATSGIAFLAAASGVLEKFGRNSLFVYWIHVELVYGYSTWIIHRRLPLIGAVAVYLIFCAAMYRAIWLRDWVVSWWKAGRDPKTAPRRGTALRA